jgi:hypothetical protein
MPHRLFPVYNTYIVYIPEVNFTNNKKETMAKIIDHRVMLKLKIIMMLNASS